MKTPKKPRGDASLFMPGVARREFLRHVAAATAGTGLAVTAAKSNARSSASDRPMTLNDFNHAWFALRVGARFDVESSGGAVRFELIEARLLGGQSPRPAALARREPFALTFRAPRGTSWPQRIYRIAHPDLGAFEIFLVPIGPDDQGPRYEAIFN